MQTLDLSIRTQPKDGTASRQASPLPLVSPPLRSGSLGVNAKRAPREAPGGLVDWGSSGADAGADGAELARGALAQEGDGHDADDGDQGHEQGVLDQAGAALVAAQPGAEMGQTELPSVNQGHGG